MTEKKKVIIIGAGPGGLSAGMILAKRGFEVRIFEKENQVGGRNGALLAGDYTFEIGPTFVMLPDVFKEVFSLAGRKLEDYVDLIRLDPMYRLQFADGRDFNVYFDKNKLKTELERLFPGEYRGYEKYLKSNKKKFDRLYKCLKVPYIRIYHYLRWKLLKALPVIDPGFSVHDVLSRYFKNEDLKIAMSFQAKYLGMSPWDCPGAFTILSYVEHAFGVYHPRGGVHKISEAMAKILEEEGGQIEFNSKIKEIIFKNKKAIGVKLDSGENVFADYVVMNTDFAEGVSKLIETKDKQKYTDKKLVKMKYSCSTFMLYLGVKKKYDLTHHSIILAKDYRKNVDEIFKNKTLPSDPSFYVQNAGFSDSSLAPSGKSAIYCLVPVPNLLNSKIDWQKEKNNFRDLILQKIVEKTEMKDLIENIEVERVITPLDWQEKMNVFGGAVFNLSHSLDQMLYLRPHNELEGYKNLFIVGGGTHPGSGLPTIIESGRITADLISGV